MNVDILYGSATGNAEYIAKDLAALINNNDKNNDDDNGNNHPRPFTSAACMEMNHFKRKKLFETWSAGPPSPSSSSSPSPTKHAVIVICSTTGNGDAPENASRFVRFLKKPPPSSSPLRHVAFAVLGLGDTNYDRFCEAGKLIDRKLAEWGGTRAVALACADEATGLEATVEPWLEGVLGGLARACTGKYEEEEEGKGKETEEVGKKLEKEKETKADASSLANDLEKTLILSPETTAPLPSKEAMQSPTPLFILYGSATGNAEHMAKDLAASYQTTLRQSPTSAYFPSVTCCPLNDYKKKCLDVWSSPPPSPSTAKHGVLFLCSTTGNADAPENADRFVRWLKRKSTESTLPFQHCAYAVLGLGDSNYDVFCAMGKLIDRKVGELGGTRARSVACADEATGLEEVVEPWVKGVVDDLAKVCRGMGDGDVAVAVDSTSTLEDATTPTATGDATTPATSELAKEESSASEEKKMDDEPSAPQPNPPPTPIPTPPSAGVATLRQHLGLAPQDPLPAVPNSCLPAMTSNLSSCEFVRDDPDNDDDDHHPATGAHSVADNLTETSGSSGFHFTLTRPYESRILNARYLTKGTGVECARKVCEMMSKATTIAEKTKSREEDAACRDEEEEKMAERDSLLMQAMEMYEQHFPLAPSNHNGENEQPQQQHKLQYDKNGKRVIEMTLALPDDFTLEYEPGDSVGLLVPNAPHATRFVLDMLRAHHGILPAQKIVVDGSRPISVGEAVRNKMDLCSPVKKKRLFLLSQYATDPEERRALRLLSANGSASASASGMDDKSGQAVGDLFQTYVEEQHRSIVDILKEFPSCQSIPLEGLFGILPAIPPRYYSVCSSPLSEKEVIHGHSFHLKVAFSVVDYLTPSSPNDPNSHRRMGGVATRYLECLCSPFLCNDSSATTTTTAIQIFPKPTHDFRLPTDLSTPLVLIGPGTGIAPFLGFLSHRQAQLSSLESKQAAEMASEGTWRGGYELDPEELNISHSEARGLNLAVDYMRKQRHGEIDLFFGCRYRDHDWLYEKEVEEFRAMGIVSCSYNAFSREEGREKMYVQTLMLKDEACGSRLVDMITQQMASVYICGDGNAMGRDVQEAITKLLAEKKFAKQSDEREAMEKAVEYVDQMKRSGRFVLDIWS